MMICFVGLTSGGCCTSILTPVFSDVTSNAEETSIKSEIKNAYSAYVAECAIDGMGYSSIDSHLYYNGENYFWYDGTKANSYEAGYYIGEYAGWEIYYPADSYVDNGEWG
jgi:hypothetical protein